MGVGARLGIRDWGLRDLFVGGGEGVEAGMLEGGDGGLMVLEA